MKTGGFMTGFLTLVLLALVVHQFYVQGQIRHLNAFVALLQKQVVNLEQRIAQHVARADTPIAIAADSDAAPARRDPAGAASAQQAPTGADLPPEPPPTDANQIPLPFASGQSPHAATNVGEEPDEAAAETAPVTIRSGEVALPPVTLSPVRPPPATAAQDGSTERPALGQESTPRTEADRTPAVPVIAAREAPGNAEEKRAFSIFSKASSARRPTPTLRAYAWQPRPATTRPPHCGR